MGYATSVEDGEVSADLSPLAKTTGTLGYAVPVQGEVGVDIPFAAAFPLPRAGGRAGVRATGTANAQSNDCRAGMYVQYS